MAAAPPPFTPNLGPPQVPAGWRAEWSAEHNTWYYLNLTTNASQWNFPVEHVQPAYGAFPPSPPIQQYSTYPQQQQQPVLPQQSENATVPEQDATPGPDGERGLGKIAAGGLLGVAGGLLAGAIFKHEEDEGKIQKPHFWANWGNNSDDSVNIQQNSNGPSSWFSKFGGGISKPDFAVPAVAASAGGLFGSMASHTPHMPASNNNAPPRPYGAPPPHHAPAPQQYSSPPPQHQPQQQAAPIYATPTYHTGNNPPLHIHCAAWADQDVTHLIRRLVTPNQSIDFNTDELLDVLGDPWPGAPKQFSIVYSYGPRPWEVVATASGRGKFSLLPHEPLSKDRMSYIQPPTPGGRIVAVVWGRGDALDQGKVEKLKEIETTGEFQATESWAGFDNLWGPGKVAVAYYRCQDGSVKFAAARDGGTVRLPWNPLARWS